MQGLLKDGALSIGKLMIIQNGKRKKCSVKLSDLMVQKSIKAGSVVFSLWRKNM